MTGEMLNHIGFCGLSGVFSSTQKIRQTIGFDGFVFLNLFP